MKKSYLRQIVYIGVTFILIYLTLTNYSKPALDEMSELSTHFPEEKRGTTAGYIMAILITAGAFGPLYFVFRVCSFIFGKVEKVFFTIPNDLNNTPDKS